MCADAHKANVQGGGGGLLFLFAGVHVANGRACAVRKSRAEKASKGPFHVVLEQGERQKRTSLAQ